MKILVAIALFAVSIVFTGRAQAASPHTLTWTPQSGNPGKVVTLAGQTFVLIRMPVRDFGSARRYAVSFLAPRTGILVQAPLTTVHSKEALTDPILIEGFDATVTVTDGRSYNILSNFSSPGDYTFTVTAHASCTVQIKVGQTLITLIGHIPVVQQPGTNIGDTPNAVPHADWADYVHPSAQLTACDKWLDYVRIQEVP
jgi:hypothetical protein